jgi:hypothetical protein
MKTSELTGAALDWAVAKAERLDCYVDMRGSRNGWATFVDFGEHTHIRYTPSEHWGFGGPIIEREWISLECWPNESDEGTRWAATRYEQPAICEAYGPTPLIAAMRCYVAACLGDEIELPEELK